MPELDMVVLGVPNDLHCQVTLDSFSAGKHVVIEKPLCMNLAEADQMLAAAAKANRKFMYAEELCFAPKYVRLKQLLDSGALGSPTLVKQSEKHDGPHAPHFWDARRSGGGVTTPLSSSAGFWDGPKSPPSTLKCPPRSTTKKRGVTTTPS
jgi:myo-inositol 2-dehydrogenase / D-chiro-inositol 1-dehydrogenase